MTKYAGGQEPRGSRWVGERTGHVASEEDACRWWFMFVLAVGGGRGKVIVTQQPDGLYSGRELRRGLGWSILEGAFRHVEVGDLEWS